MDWKPSRLSYGKGGDGTQKGHQLREIECISTYQGKGSLLPCLGIMAWTLGYGVSVTLRYDTHSGTKICIKLFNVYFLF